MFYTNINVNMYFGCFENVINNHNRFAACTRNIITKTCFRNSPSVTNRMPFILYRNTKITMSIQSSLIPPLHPEGGPPHGGRSILQWTIYLLRSAKPSAHMYCRTNQIYVVCAINRFWFTSDEVIFSLTLNNYVRMSFVCPIPNDIRMTSMINNKNAGNGNFYTALDVCSE